MNNPKLDLHGIRHHNVDILVENFIYKNQCKAPLIIICGNSQQMINLVETTLNRIGCSYEQSRFGVLRILKI